MATAARAFAVPDDVANLAAPEPDDAPVAGNVATAAANDEPIAYDFAPSNEEELAQCLADPMWRLCSGQLYKILIKSKALAQASMRAAGNAAAAERVEETTAPFKPNRAQRRFIARLWHRNLILKARQLGFTTLICIMWLDHALFNPNQRCGVIAQDRETAESLFRDKVKFAYDRLPPELLAAFPLKKDNASELLFAHNNSSIRVATSMRSGTIHRLLVSEFGAIAADDPDKADEVVTGSLPAVPSDGIAVIESTAKGQEGEFYKMSTLAEAADQAGAELSEKEFRFHFFPWWGEKTYRLSRTGSSFTQKDNLYFHEIEAQIGQALDIEQRNWYVATRDAEYSGDPEKMWQEYPSTPKEAFQVSTEGVYYAQQLADARKAGRICKVPHTAGTPVNTFWDIGSTDGTAIWFHQRIGFENRFIRFIEGWNEPYSHFIEQMQKLGYVWGTHYLPHDAGHKRQQGAKVQSPEDELRAFKIGGTWTVLPAVDEVIQGIQLTRKVFPECWFDAELTKEGIAHLGSYRKTWNKARAGWNATVPSKVEGHSEAADALRQFGQGYIAPRLAKQARAKGNWRTA